MATTIQSGRASSPLLTADVASRAEVYGGRGLVFDGTSDYLSVNDDGTNGNGLFDHVNVSVSFWTKIPTSGSSFPMYPLATFEGQIAQFVFTMNSATQLIIQNNNSSSPISNIPTIATGVWEHWVATREPWSGQSNSDAHQFKVYRNGELIATRQQNSAWLLHKANLTIGRKGNSDSGYFNGSMCDMKIWTGYTLSLSEIQEIYKKPEQSAPSASLSYLSAWYPMSEANPESPQSILYDHSEKKLQEVTTDSTFQTDVASNQVGSHWKMIGNGMSISGGKLRYDKSLSSGKFRPMTDASTEQTFTSGVLYKLTLTIDEITNDATPRIQIDLSNFRQGGSTYMYLEVGTHTFYGTGGGGNQKFVITQNEGDCVISVCKIEQVLMGNHATTNFFGDDLLEGYGNFSDASKWSGVDNGFSITGDKLVAVNAQNNIYRDIPTSVHTIENGKSYQATFTISDYVDGYVKFAMGGNDGGTLRSGNGTYTETITITNRINNFIYISTYDSPDLKIDNFTVKEVGVSSTGFTTAQNEPVIPQIPLVKYNEKMLHKGISGQYVDVLMPSVSDFSFGFWYNTDSDAGTFIGKSTYAVLRYQSNLIAFRGSSSSNVVIYIASSNIKNGNFIVFVREGTTFKIYIDGVLKTTTTSSVPTENLNFGSNARIGSSAWDKFNGIIHECSIFNSALTQTQIQELFNDGVALDATTHSKADDHLLGYWRNDGVTTWTDRGDIQAIGFDGSDDYISTGALDSALEPPLSISMWVKGDAQNGKTLIQDDNTTSGLLYTRQGNEISLYTSAGDKSYSYTLDNTWAHIVMTQASSAKPLVYVNGDLLSDGSQDFTPNPSFSNIRIGGDYGKFKGHMSQVAIWSKVLSSPEISAIYALGRRNVDLTTSYSANLKGYWLLNPTHSNPDLTGNDKILDRSGNGNHGTQNGGVNFLGANDGDVQGTPDSITIREGLNSNKDGLGFPLTDSSSNVLRLNGVSEFVHIENDNLAGKPTGTICFWAKTSSTGNQAILGYHRDQWSIRLNKTTILFGVGGTTVTASSSLDNSGWGFHAITFDQGTAKFYKLDLDTPLYHTSTDYLSAGDVVFPSNTNGVFIGKRNHASEYFYNGLVDEVRIYDRVLTLDEITKNYKHQKGKHKND